MTASGKSDSIAARSFKEVIARGKEDRAAEDVRPDAARAPG